MKRNKSVRTINIEHPKLGRRVGYVRGGCSLFLAIINHNTDTPDMLDCSLHYDLRWLLLRAALDSTTLFHVAGLQRAYNCSL